MSPRGKTISRRKRNALIGGGAGLAGAATIASILIAMTGSTEDMIPPHGGTGDLATYYRIDLLASRDADKVTPCGLPAGGAGDNKPLVADQTWTRTGGSLCYPISATAAQCFDATEIPYTVDATGTGWVVEPDSINRIPYSTAIDLVNWSAIAAPSATTLQTAPDGSATATTVTVSNANKIYQNSAGYSNSAALTLRSWVKCATGTFRMYNSRGTAQGEWLVDCSAIAGNWTLINASHAAVTVSTPWSSGGTGLSGIVLAGPTPADVTATVWAPTETEEPGTGLSVIPTAAAAVSTGDIGWSIANGLRNTGSQLLADGDMEAVGTSAYTGGNNATLTKESGSPHGGLQSLRIAHGGSNNPYAYQVILTAGKRYRVIGWATSDGTVIPRIESGTDILWTGTTSTSYQAADVTFLAASTTLILRAATTGAGWVEFDDITVYEQQPYGRYYHSGDTVTQSLTTHAGTCWDTTTDTSGALLLSGAAGSECAGVWYGLQVSR